VTRCPNTFYCRTLVRCSRDVQVPAGGGSPNRPRGQHGGHLRQQLRTARAPRQLNAGVDPDLVFKIKAGARPEDSAFEGRGLQVLGESIDYTYFVLASDQGASLEQAIEQYVRTGELRTFFNQIDDIEPYGPADRTGPGIADLDGSTSGQHTARRHHLAQRHVR
jgi:hypothetical protein